MKKSLASFLILFGCLTFASPQVFAEIKGFSMENTIINTGSEKALNVSWLQDDNPIRQGMYDMTTEKGKDGINNPAEIGDIINQDKIETHGWAVEATLKLIQIIINRSLGILGLVALIYLIYNGFMMTTAHGDEKQFDKGKSWVKTAVIALAGIALSWFIVSMLLWIITQLTKSS